jgi:hypothetical protein
MPWHRPLHALMAAAHLLSARNTLADQGGRHMGSTTRTSFDAIYV